MALEDDHDESTNSYLEELKQQYKSSAKQIEDNLERLKVSPPKQIRSILEQCKVDLTQCKVTKKEMEQEMKLLHNKSKWTLIINKHQTHYAALKSQFENAKAKAQKRDVYYDQHIKNEAMLHQAKQDTNVLKDTHKELLETELNAADVMATLDDQTVQIKKIKDNVTESNNLLDNMGKTIKQMARRWWA
eukprot:247006_1